MPLSKFIIIVINLSFLVIPLNVINAQLKIYSSEGIEVIGDPKAFESSKGENWTRVYAPGEQEKEYREAVKRERVEQQQKAREEKAADERYHRNKELELKKRAVEAMEQAASRPTIIVKPQPRDYIAVDPQTGKAISVIPID